MQSPPNFVGKKNQRYNNLQSFQSVLPKFIPISQPNLLKIMEKIGATTTTIT